MDGHLVNGDTVAWRQKGRARTVSLKEVAMQISIPRCQSYLLDTGSETSNGKWEMDAHLGHHFNRRKGLNEFCVTLLSVSTEVVWFRKPWLLGPHTLNTWPLLPSLVIFGRLSLLSFVYCTNDSCAFCHNGMIGVAMFYSFY